MLRKSFEVCLGDYCRMSVLLSRPCAEVRAACESEPDQEQVSQHALQQRSARRNDTPPSKNKKGKKRRGPGGTHFSARA